MLSVLSMRSLMILYVVDNNEINKAINCLYEPNDVLFKKKS